MSLDLNTLLKDWPHESGAIKVRKILGLDGNEKLQLRIDLGVLQMEIPAGRTATGRTTANRCSTIISAVRPAPRRAGMPTNSVRAMQRAAAGRHSVLPSLSQSLSDQ